ncbi:hypothetical protein AMTR_s00024p00014560 [Amborella trichopoda]|uniref:Oberon coiled-coil region domain-containing protein n=1 Tax=Amborella trichopoda TaxID=13333 RepID=W1PSI0_AMBTC|nr:hypothetical protein AMTR_s00024p00014560 [Amborella trichopoda]
MNFDSSYILYTAGASDISGSNCSSKELAVVQRDVSGQPPVHTQDPIYRANSSSIKGDIHRNSNSHERVTGEEVGFQRSLSEKKVGFDSLEGLVKMKEAEAIMFQSRADDAQKEAEGLKRIARAKSAKLEEEYVTKLAKLCLNEAEDKRKKKMEELKVLESSHCDYHNMKMRMEAEIASLLERMEATKKQWV